MSSEIFQEQLNQALAGLEGVLDIVDDVLIYGVGDTEEKANADHDQKLIKLLREMSFRRHSPQPRRAEIAHKDCDIHGPCANQ